VVSDCAEDCSSGIQRRDWQNIDSAVVLRESGLTPLHAALRQSHYSSHARSKGELAWWLALGHPKLRISLVNHMRVYATL